MALRKFVFINSTEGFSQEQAASDELSLGKITFLGVEGVAINAGSAKIVSVADGVAANDAVNKGQLEGVEADYQAADAATLASANSYTDGRETDMRADWAADDAAITTAYQAADSALDGRLDVLEGADTVAGSVAKALKDAKAYTDTRETAITTAYQAADSSITTAYQAADSALDGRLDILEGADTVVGSVAKALKDAKAYTDTREGIIRTDFAAADAATLSSAQTYADSLLAGFTVKAPVKAASTGGNVTLNGADTPMDGVSLAVGDRVLVKDQTDATQNGIYVVAAGAWSRAADANSDAEVKDGLSVFVEQGTLNADDTFVLVTNNAITLGTSALSFVKFSGIGQVTAGDGLSKSADTLNVNVGDGIAIVSDAVAVNLATDPGLQFTSNKLDLKLDSNGGLSKDSAGLKAVSANADRVSVSSSGIDVVGLPSSFKINGSAVNSDVNATNLNGLVQGQGTSTTLHNHHFMMQWIEADASIAQGNPVYFSGANKVSKASCSSAATAKVIGISGGNANVGQSAGVVFSGSFAGILDGTTFARGDSVYLGSNGAMVQYASLTSGDRIIRLGFARSATDLQVMIQDMGQKA